MRRCLRRFWRWSKECGGIDRSLCMGKMRTGQNKEAVKYVERALIRDKELGKKGKGELEEALKKFQDLARGFLEENPTGCSPPKLAWDDLRQKRFEWVLMKDLICWLVYTDDFYQSKDQTEDSTKGIEAVQIYC
ncbi:hypothetical protein NC651_013008 [Populus alba x Populus x berolinensis]|nr:hypothetical protein NC651_013008 [Populus alba x Populus x berolinensis]